MEARKRLPPTVLEAALCHLIEMGEDNTVSIPVDRLNEAERRVELEYEWEGEHLVLSTVDVDDDTTDPVSDQFPAIPPRVDLGKGTCGFTDR